MPNYTREGDGIDDEALDLLQLRIKDKRAEVDDESDLIKFND